MKPLKTRFFWQLVGIFLMVAHSGSAQKNFKIYLVGDAGDHTESGETLRNLKTELVSNPNSAVVFLGDNSYKDVLWGLIPFGFKGFDSTRNTMDKIISQLSLVDNYKGSVFFTPGNHDWWNRTTYKKGRPKLAMEESFIEANLKLNNHIANRDNVFLPRHGGYGPESVELDSGRIRIIFIDTYRIIQTGIKKEKIPPDEALFYDRLDSVIKAGYVLNQKVLVVAHHPVHSIGPNNNPLKHPYLQRRIKASNATFPSYLAMSEAINKILIRYPGVYYASGHLHALQYYFTKDSIHYIVSGAGSKEHELTEKEIMMYNTQKEPDDYLLWNSGGFFEIDFSGQSSKTFLYFDEASKKCSLP
jgi:hypothetical protein